MITILNRIAIRAKKWLILLIIIPLLTGAISYYLESKKQTVYTAKTTIEPGNFENEWMADSAEVERSLKTEEYFTQVKDLTMGTFTIEDVNARLIVTSPTGKKLLMFQYTGTDEDEVKKTLNDLAIGYKKIRDVKYKAKVENQRKIIAYTESVPKEGFNPLNSEAFFKVMNIDYMETRILDPVKVSASYNDPVKRAIFGLILGLMLNIVILITPELFREYR